MKCPICGKPAQWKDNPNRPFCSERCRIIDLGNWSSEEYHVSIPITDVDEKVDEERP
jgi:endogenous inhibitor of DNA gyrase (YacG/DUF329 family)